MFDSSPRRPASPLRSCGAISQKACCGAPPRGPHRDLRLEPPRPAAQNRGAQGPGSVAAGRRRRAGRRATTRPWAPPTLDGADERLTRGELAERARVPPSMLRSLEGSGILRPLPADDPERPYSRADVKAVRMLLALVSAGVPMEEFMAVAKHQIDTSDASPRARRSCSCATSASRCTTASRPSPRRRRTRRRVRDDGAGGVVARRLPRRAHAGERDGKAHRRRRHQSGAEGVQGRASIDAYRHAS